MPYLLDYSAAKLSGATIKAAGYTGVIRYIDSPANLGRKHTDLNEYRSHVAAGLSVMLVMQTTTTASDGGYAAGQDHARRALAGANYLGYGGPLFFTNDRTTVPNAANWRSYLDGAASVLGLARVGAYGFRNAMDLAVGHASYFWQAGRRSDVAAHTHVWQDNNTQVTVGGVLCDRNLILKSITEEDDMTPAQANQLQYLYDALINGGDSTPYGWSLQNLLKATHGNGLAVLTESVPEIKARQDALEAKVDSLKVAGVDVAQLVALLAPALTDAVADKLAERLAD